MDLEEKDADETPLDDVEESAKEEEDAPFIKLETRMKELEENFHSFQESLAQSMVSVVA